MPLMRAEEPANVSVANDTSPHANAGTAKRATDDRRKRARTMAKQQQAAERIATACNELASSVTEASSAVEELRKSMQQIASGANEASGASQESQAAMTQIAGRVERQATAARETQDKTRVLQQMVENVAGGVSNMVESVGVAAKRQNESVKMMIDLEKQAANINEAVKQVIRIADQTNLLALNAAIEAARAGRHGKGFAVVADAVRTLAENSEKNAASIQGLVSKIQETAKSIAEAVSRAAQNAVTEADKGRSVNQLLKGVRADMQLIYEGSEDLTRTAAEMSAASTQALKASENIAAAAQEQSSACDESLKSLEQQAQAMNQAERASQELDEVSGELRNSANVAKSAEGVAAAAEELSSSVEEMNRSSAEIRTAIQQIAEVSVTQGKMAEEAASGIQQIEHGVKLAEDRSKTALDRGIAMTQLLGQNRKSVMEMIDGVRAAMEEGRQNLRNIQELEQVSGRIDKIVDAIGNVAIQTSMLAVSGAVEAARAGEYGKGFAVVSTDIQNLANDAAVNAEQIKDQVKAIQTQLLVVRTDLAAIADASVREVESAQSSAAGLQTIETEMATVLKGSKDINQAALEIATAVEQARKGTEQIAAAAQEAAKAASEASAAAAQQAQGAKELVSAIEEIAAIADELQQGA